MNTEDQKTEAKTLSSPALSVAPRSAIPPPHFATPEEIMRTLDRECQLLQAENAKLREVRAQLAEARKDTERLDWLFKYGAGSIAAIINDNTPQHAMDFDLPARQAIDVARSATP